MCVFADLVPPFLPNPQTRQFYVVGWRAAAVRSTPYLTWISHVSDSPPHGTRHTSTCQIRCDASTPYEERGGWGQPQETPISYREAYVWCPCKTDKRAAWLVRKLALAACPRRGRRTENHSTRGKNTLSRYITPSCTGTWQQSPTGCDSLGWCLRCPRTAVLRQELLN